MVPTFSVNASPYSKEKVNKIASIINSINDSARNREWAGEAFLKIVESDGPGVINLSAYALTCETNTKMTENARPVVSILTTEEYNNGYAGVTDIVAEYVEDNIDNILSNMDIDYYVEAFLNARERIFFNNGLDIWRLLKLSKLDDKVAQKKLRSIMDEFNLREILSYILTKRVCYNKLEGILC